MKDRKLLYLILFILFIIWVSGPLYVVPEGKQVIITQFGKPVGKPVTRAGLHFKVPFIQKAHYFEKRILEWDGYPNQIPTRDKKYLWVDTTARWRISDPLKFYQSVHDERGGQARLDDIIDAVVRDVITSHNLIEIVRSTNRILQEKERVGTEEEMLGEGAREKISVGREEIMRNILETARPLTREYGIELIDVKIKRVNYVEEVRKKAYERMIAERKRAAERYRSEGRGIRAEIEGKTEKELKKILSEAYRKSQEIKGKAESEVTRIYAEAYTKDPEFYSFLKTLETYRKTVDDKTTLILTTKSEIYRLLKELSQGDTSF